MTQIKDLPSPYKEMALANQKLQGNVPNENVQLSYGQIEGGFNWAPTHEGYNFWYLVSYRKTPMVFNEIKANYPDIFPVENKEVLVEGKEPCNHTGLTDTGFGSFCEICNRHVYKNETSTIEADPYFSKGKEVKEESLADLKERIKTLEGIIDLKEKERQEWADMCIKKQAEIEALKKKYIGEYDGFK